MKPSNRLRKIKLDDFICVLKECHIGREIELHKYGHDLKASGGISNPRLQMRRASNLGKHRAPSTGTRGSSIVQS